MAKPPPLSEQQQRKLSMKFSIEYNYNSNHMEGNTLTYGQTELLLLFGKVSGEASLKDFNDMKASEVSVRMMLEESLNKKIPLTQNFIRTLHHISESQLESSIIDHIREFIMEMGHGFAFVARQQRIRTDMGDY